MSGRIGCWVGALLLLACDLDPASVLGLLGIRNVGTVSAETASGWLAQDRAVLVQVRGDGRSQRALPAAVRMAPLDPIPAVLREAGGRPLLVVATREDLSLRVAARLVRAGLPRVSVIEGDLTPLLGTRTARTRRSLAQPSRTHDHPRD